MTIKVDLLPTEKRGFQIDPLVIVLIVFVLATSGAFYYYGQTLEQQIKRLEEERAGVEQKIKECETANKAIEAERQRLAKLEQQFQLVKNLMHDPLKIANLMSEFGALLPESVYVDSLSIEPGPSNIAFGGKASGALPLSVIAATMKNINESIYFDSASLGSASRGTGDEENSFTFQMTVHYDATQATNNPPGTKDGQGAATAPPPPQPEGPGGPESAPEAPATPAASATPAK